MADRAVSRAASRVAAICYRQNGNGVELLLVRTSTGKWTLPKGKVREGERDSEAARREAAEEGGVTGQITDGPAASFLQAARDPGSGGVLEVTVPTYLLRVSEQGVPRDPSRVPTWFSLRTGIELLAVGRPSRYAYSLQSAVAEAVRRLERC